MTTKTITTENLNEIQIEILERVAEYGIVSDRVVKIELFGDLNQREEKLFIKNVKHLIDFNFLTSHRALSQLENFNAGCVFKLTERGVKVIKGLKLNKGVKESYNITSEEIEDLRDILRDFNKRLNDIENTLKIIINPDKN